MKTFPLTFSFALTLALTLSSLPLLAQQKTLQHGLVRELNSGKKPLGGVSVKFDEAVPTNSDDQGNFRLAFLDKKPGEHIFLIEAQKQGYELVNGKELEVLKISDNDSLGRDLILAKAGVVEAAKKQYYGVSDSALLASFEREKRSLRARLKKAELSEAAFSDQLQALQAQYDLQKQNLDALAEKFARVNFDDVEPIYEEALRLFLAGKVNEAITALEGAGLLTRTQQIIQEEQRLIGAQAELDNQKAALVKEKSSQIKAVRLLADMYSVTFDPIKAEVLYDDLLLLDSTNLEILIQTTEFYQEQHRYDKAKRVNWMVIRHPEVEEWEVANAYWRLGDLQTVTGSLPNALVTYTQFHEKYKNLLKEEPSSSFNKKHLAISYAKLGETHNARGNLEPTLTFFQECSRLSKELYDAYPESVSLKNGLAIAYEKLGETHTWLGQLDSALTFFQERSRLAKELYNAYPDNVDFKYGLAISYEKLGSTHTSLGQLDSALTFFQNETQLFKKLYDVYPYNIASKNGLAIAYEKLGSTHTSLGQLDSALTFFQEQSRLGKELYDAYPNNVNFKYGLSVSYSKLGSTTPRWDNCTPP